jgi:hypothetical protein
VQHDASEEGSQNDVEADVLGYHEELGVHIGPTRTQPPGPPGAVNRGA